MTVLGCRISSSVCLCLYVSAVILCLLLPVLSVFVFLYPRLSFSRIVSSLRVPSADPLPELFIQSPSNLFLHVYGRFASFSSTVPRRHTLVWTSPDVRQWVPTPFFVHRPRLQHRRPVRPLRQARSIVQYPSVTF